MHKRKLKNLKKKLKMKKIALLRLNFKPFRIKIIKKQSKQLLKLQLLKKEQTVMLKSLDLLLKTKSNNKSMKSN